MIREKQFLSPLFSVPGSVSKGEFTRRFTGDAARCHYCGRPTYYKTSRECAVQPHLTRTVDHKIPRARGGTDRQCLISCRRCNAVKGDTPYEVFVAWCAVYDPWRQNAEREYREFVYDCAHAGLKAGRDLAAWMKRQGEPKAGPVIDAFERFRASRAA